MVAYGSTIQGWKNCTTEKWVSNDDLLGWPQVQEPLPNLVLLNHLKDTTFPVCLAGNGSTNLGWLPGRLCNCTYSYCTTIGKSWNTSWQFPLKDNQQNLTRCSSMAQTPKGTQVLADWYFLCGHKAFLSLPAGWGGLCTLVILSDHIFFMDRLENHPRNQNKREINVASPNAFGVTVDTGVPRELRVLPKPSPKCRSRRGA